MRGNAQISGNAQVSGNALVDCDAQVSGDAKVSVNARVIGNARVSGTDRASGNVKLSGNIQQHYPAQAQDAASTETLNHCVYMATSPNGMAYIGQTVNYEERCKEHQKGGYSRFNSAIKEYGWDNFTHRILAGGLSSDDANELEECFIDWLGTISPLGYNQLPGGSATLSQADLGRIEAARAIRAYQIQNKDRGIPPEST